MKTTVAPLAGVPTAPRNSIAGTEVPAPNTSVANALRRWDRRHARDANERRVTIGHPQLVCNGMRKIQFDGTREKRDKEQVCVCDHSGRARYRRIHRDGPKHTRVPRTTPAPTSQYPLLHPPSQYKSVLATTLLLPPFPQSTFRKLTKIRRLCPR